MNQEQIAQRIRQENRHRINHNEDKMITFIRGFCSDRQNPKPETIKALSFMIKTHQNQRRVSGEPYIIHPLSMACFAIGLSMTNDDFIATLLLHDVCEDTATSIDDLPSSDIVKRSVECVTIKKLPSDKNDDETKRRYYEQLLEEPYSVLCKAIDRYTNLSDMIGVFDKDRIAKNVRETHDRLLPILKQAQSIYPEYSNELYILRTIIQNFNDNLAIIYEVNLYAD